MREIKFRGICIKTNGFIYGGFSHFEGIEDTYIIVFDCGPVDYETGHCENYLNPMPVDHKTVGQFTGLYDSKGLEIYEGDILQVLYKCCLTGEWKSDYLIEVYYDLQTAQYWGRCRNGEEIGSVWDSFIEHGYIAPLEIIGNIHENPELLKQGEL